MVALQLHHLKWFPSLCYFLLVVGLYHITAPEDYSDLNEDLLFNLASSGGNPIVECVNITIGDDQIREATESFTIRLNNSFQEPVNFRSDTATVEITDDDGTL